VCLIGANLVVRRETFDQIGGFSGAVQRVGAGGGSTEDQEWQMRLWAGGGFGVYEPALAVRAVVGAERVGKRHHRSWHFGHGRHVARMHVPDVEASRWRVLGVPGHLLRATVADAASWLRRCCAGDQAGAFEREVRLWFAAGFVRERWG
jgi:hypothetical protein